MKSTRSLKFTIVLAIVVGLSMNTFADGNSNDPADKKERSAKSTNMLKVRSDSDTYVWLLNQEGREVYSDNISKSYSTAKMYDFSMMKNGVYTMITKTEQRSVEKTIKVENGMVEVVEEKERYIPHFSIDENYLLVNYLNVNADDISIELESAYSAFFKEESGNDRSYGKKIDIRRLPRGEYRFVLTAGVNTYYYSFKK